MTPRLRYPARLRLCCAYDPRDRKWGLERLSQSRTLENGSGKGGGEYEVEKQLVMMAGNHHVSAIPVTELHPLKMSEAAQSSIRAKACFVFLVTF